MQREDSPVIVQIRPSLGVWLVIVPQFAMKGSCVLWSSIDSAMELLTIPILDRCVPVTCQKVLAVGL